MAREPQDIIKAQLGSLMAEVAILTSQNEQKDEEIVKLKAQLPKDNTGPSKPKDVK